MSPETILRLNAFWAEFFGVSPADLESDRTRVGPHRGLGEYAGLFLFRKDACCIVSVPAPFPVSLRETLSALAPEAVFATARLTELLGRRVERIIGPAWTGYVDAASLRPVETRGARPLGPGDVPALERLRAACPPLEWEHSAVGEAEVSHACGVFQAGELVAAAICRPLGEHLHQRLGDVGLITHPEFRGRGYGRAVAAALSARALRDHAALRWQTLAENLPSVGVARALGYQEYARTLAVRLQPGM